MDSVLTAGSSGDASGERRVLARARDVLAGGRDVLDPVPTPEELGERSAPERHQLLDEARVEMHAIASILADRVLQRAQRERPEYPPYGLARSSFSQTRMVADFPEPYEQGSIDSFATLGRALIDTVVLHLDRELRELRQSDQDWLVQRLELLLSMFRLDAGSTARARMRDSFAFMYGGLHFGTSVSVQMVEVMARILKAGPVMTASQRADAIAESIRAPHKLAALNIDHVPLVYERMLSTVPGRRPPTAGASAPWFGTDHFVLRGAGGGRRFELRLGDIVTTTVRREQPQYVTQGCPARFSPSANPSPIDTIWSWCIELALSSGLLDGDATPSG